VSWAWFSGGWSNAAGNVGAPGWTNGPGPNCSDPNALGTAVFPNCPDKLFQFHHQAFNYFMSFAPGTQQRAAHLRDEVEFITLARAGNLPDVSFVKPIGEENEHPGYTGENSGSSHLVDLLKAIFGSEKNQDVLVIVTYDEFGGQWDHVSPPGMGSAGPHDQWGPGTRIPALILSSKFKASGVDHTSYDTTSILRSIERKFGVAPLGPRDASVNDLSPAVSIGQ
jgi:acid phosphatase